MHVFQPMPLPPTQEHLDAFVCTFDKYRMFPLLTGPAQRMIDELVIEYELLQTERHVDHAGPTEWDDVIDRLKEIQLLLPALIADTVEPQFVTNI